MKTFGFIIISFFFLLINSCANNLVDPEDKIYHEGSRDYKWKKMPLNDNAPLNSYVKLWGSKSNDIWIVGGAGDFDKTIIRYDGTNIRSLGRYSVDPRVVFGTISNEIWIAGSEFDIWKYNGSFFSKYTQMPLAGYVNSYFGDIWGDAANNILAVGSLTEDLTGKIKGAILQYDGNKWKYVIGPNDEIFYSKIRRASNDNKYYLVGIRVRSNSPDSSDFYEYDGAKVNPIYIADGNDPIGKSITLLDGKIYFCYETEIYKKTNGGIKHFISLKNSQVDGVHIWGRNENDFFIETKGGIGHYNGTDLITLYNIDGNFGIFDGLVLDNDIYFVGYDKDTFKFFLIHGNK